MALVLAATPLLAHHSVSKEFDSARAMPTVKHLLFAFIAGFIALPASAQADVERAKRSIAAVEETLKQRPDDANDARIV
jgi:hypothetical protein